MASVISHAAAAAAISTAFAPNGAPARFWPVAIATAVLPDADSFLRFAGGFYSPVLSHRGFFHSLFFGLVVSFLLMVVFFRAEGFFSRRWIHYFCLFFVIWASHGLLDALTNGGRGVAFFSPFSAERYFFPWRPIQVSPMRVKSFIGSRGLFVLKSELVWIWLPGFVLVLLSRIIRPWISRRNLR